MAAWAQIQDPSPCYDDDDCYHTKGRHKNEDDEDEC